MIPTVIIFEALFPKKICDSFNIFEEKKMFSNAVKTYNSKLKFQKFHWKNLSYKNFFLNLSQKLDVDILSSRKVT